MRARVTKLLAALAVVSALAVGGATLASATSKAPSPTPAAAVDGDTLQQGDQTTADTGGAAESSSESASSEPAGESSFESAPSDGPGGHADDPANANADNQFEGVQ